jgi:hypothetical protein
MMSGGLFVDVFRAKHPDRFQNFHLIFNLQSFKSGFGC